MLATCHRLPYGSQFASRFPYVMYSLRHAVNLSRRACKTVSHVLLLLLLLGGGRAKPPDHASDSHRHGKPSQGNLDTNSYDFEALYKTISTPSAATPGDGGNSRNAVPVQDNTERFDNTIRQQEKNVRKVVPTEKTQGKKEVIRYPIISVSFYRVETPFIIALWIFCASLSKIGKQE